MNKQLVKEYTQPITINGHVLGATIRISYEYEYDKPDFDYGCPIENEKEMQRFESGELLSVLLIVEASVFGESRSDFLGQVIVTAKNMESDLLDCVNEHGMTEIAIIALKESIQFKAKALAKFA